ncbi:membrane protein [Synergistales bacterium]|nr:membrane protein [Synergistales bacterium]
MPSSFIPTTSLPYVIGGIVLVLLVFIGLIYNSFVNLRHNSDEAFSTMDVYLKRRYDLIPNLVDVVKRYAAHERETLERVIGARNAAMGARNFEERSQGDNMLSGTLRTLFAVTENYPTLKADGAFINLQNQLIALENDIVQARKYYNGVVKVMNKKIDMFPANLFAGLLGFRRYPYFMADEYERENVRVRL